MAIPIQKNRMAFKRDQIMRHIRSRVRKTEEKGLHRVGQQPSQASGPTNPSMKRRKSAGAEGPSEGGMSQFSLNSGYSNARLQQMLFYETYFRTAASLSSSSDRRPRRFIQEAAAGSASVAPESHFLCELELPCAIEPAQILTVQGTKLYFVRLLEKRRPTSLPSKFLHMPLNIFCFRFIPLQLRFKLKQSGGLCRIAEKVRDFFFPVLFGIRSGIGPATIAACGRYFGALGGSLR